MRPVKVAVQDYTFDSAYLRDRVAELLVAVNLSEDSARIVADGLVEADEEGIASHGVMLLPLYVDRIRAGSVSRASSAEIVSDAQAVVVLDAHNMPGQVSAGQSVELAVERARQYGLGCVTVRNGFHFGTAGRYALQMAAEDCIGIVMSNTRPLLPAPGGGEALVGNNPLAIAVPHDAGGQPVVVDMALSAGAMGKIRLAEAAGDAIPAGWATDADGVPTTDPAEAIKGMLLPAAGPKGFGLALMIDLLCGGLSGGATGPDVRPLYGDMAEPYACAHFFLALDIGHFGDPAGFRDTVVSAVRRVAQSKKAPGTERVMSPGEPAWRHKMGNPGKCRIGGATFDALSKLFGECGLAGLEPAPEPRI